MLYGKMRHVGGAVGLKNREVDDAIDTRVARYVEGDDSLGKFVQRHRVPAGGSPS